MFDLTIFPLNVDSGQEQYDLPGLCVTAAPRKSARIRTQDHLLLYCHFVHSSASGRSGVPLTPAQQKEILTRLSGTYFTTTGSVTAGLRAMASRLNEFLLDRNLRAAQEGQTVGMLNMVVLHGSSLIVGQVGAAHTFVLTRNSVEHFGEGVTGSAARGLGLSRVAIPRFYQAELEPGDLMVVCDSAPAAWNARYLANSPQLTFDHFRRRLLIDGGDPFQAAVVRFQAGRGLISYWVPGESTPVRTGEGRLGRAARTGSAVAAAPTAASAAGSTAQTPTAASATPAEPVNDKPVMDTAPAAPTLNASAPDTAAPVPADTISEAPAAAPQRQAVFLGDTAKDESAPAALPSDSVSERAVPPAVRPPVARGQAVKTPPTQVPMPSESAPRPKAEKKPRPAPGPRGEGLRRMLAPLWKSGRDARTKTGMVFARAGQALPKRRDAQGQTVPFFNISRSAMLAIALIIPLVVAAVASTVYFRAGREDQFKLFFSQAQQAAEQAGQQTDPAQQKLAWSRVYELAGKAEGYQVTDATHALRSQALATLDGLDGFVRLNYQPAVTGGFAADVKITRIVTTINDVYLLDSGEGRILRLFRTATGYDVDTKFVCGGNSTQVGTTKVGPLVDMVALPPNNARRVSIMGIDTGGNLILCRVGAEGFDSRPLAVPDAGWGTITAMTVSGETLYVLDPKGNAVYRYEPNADGDYADPPHLYFDNAIPKMADVIDLAADQEFLYMLHSDGSMTLCESGGFSYANTKCTDPTPYGDARPGYEASPLSFINTQFTQIETTQPPDPSIYALDAKNRSIYHFSLRRLNLQRQYLPQPDTDFPLPAGMPTAFTISLNRRALIAFDNQVFFAPLP